MALYGNKLTFNALTTAFINELPKASFPALTLSQGGYDMAIGNITLSTVSTQAQTFSLSGQQMIFTITNLGSGGSLNYKIGKTGLEANKGKASLRLTNANLKATMAVQHTSGGLEIVYVSASQTIQSLVLSTSSSDPVVSYLIQALTPLVKSVLENGFPLLMDLLLTV